MHAGEAIRTAVGALAERKMRTALTMFGVVIGVGAVIAVSAIGEGAAEKVRNQITDRRYAHLTVYPMGDTWGLGENSTGGRDDWITPDQVRALRSDLRHARYVVPYAWADVQCRCRGEYFRLGIMPNWPDYFALYRQRIAHGRAFTDTEVETRRNVIVLGAEAAERLGGGEPLVGEKIHLNGRRFTVIGVLEPTKLRFLWRNPGIMGVIPFGSATGLMDIRYARFVRITARSADHIQPVAEEIERVLRSERGLVPGESNTFSIRNDAAMAVLEEEVVATFARMLLSIGGVSLVVGGFGIMAVMLVSVRERTPEIGVRRALGATRGAILFQFFIEALALALIGGMVGVGLGVGASAIVAHLSEWPLLLSPGAVGVAVIASAVVGLASGAWPAYRASCLDPVDALRYE